MNLFKKLWPVLFLFLGCATKPSLTTFFVSDGVNQYFVPPTEWSAQGSRASAKLDITYRTNTNVPATVNISFFGEKETPRKINSISLVGKDIECPLDNIAVIYPDLDKRKLRVTTQGNRDTIISVFEAEPVTLVAEIDGVKYTYVPDKNFIKLKNDFLVVVSY